MLRNVTCVFVVLLSVSWARSEVIIETVTVGNPGNTGELSGEGAGGFVPDRICGAVDYVYNIGTFEVTAGQYAEFLNAVAATDTYGLYNPSMDSDSYGCRITQNGEAGSYTYDFSGRPSGTEADWVDRPVNHVSWGDAARFANWLHNGQPTGAQDADATEDGSYDLSATQGYYGPDGETPEWGSDDYYALNAALTAIARKPDATWVIPTEDEWYKAAYHYNDGVTGNYYDYPTSSDSSPGYVDGSGNLSGTGTPFTEGGTDPGNYATYEGPNDVVYGIGTPYYRTVVGEWENSDSSYGAFDLGGNIWEWNEAVVDWFRGLRGGSFLYDSDGAASLHAAGRYSYRPPTHGFEGAGFRVANVEDSVVVPAVSTWGLAILGILVVTVGTVLVGRRREALAAAIPDAPNIQV